MIFQSFILDNLVSLYMKIINSVVVVGLYYGFVSTFSIGPSYLFLLRTRVMQEGTEKKLSATAGFITGQLIMFISIYYAPLHLALGRPHIITVIALPYLLFHFFGKNKQNFFNYGYKNTNSIHNFSIQRIFLNNLLFQLFNPLVFTSSILVRLVNIYIFRCNIKLLFLTSGLVGWLIGQMFFIKWIGFLFVLIQEKKSIQIQYNKVPLNKYILSEFPISMSQIFIVFFFITCLYYLGRTPLPFFLKQRESKESGQIDKIEKKKKDVKRTFERRGTKQEKTIYTEKDAYFYLFPKKKKNSDEIKENEEEKKSVFKKSLVTIFFDFNRWKRPLRYIKNAHFENVVRNEISQFFFYTCKSDGKERISFTYPPNLSTFLKMMEKKIDIFTTEKIFYYEFHNYWNFRNEEKRKKLINEFLNRAEVLDKEFIPMGILEKRIRLCDEETKKKKLPKIHDPFFNGPCRGRIQNCLLSSDTFKKNKIWINKIHALLIYWNKNYTEFEQKIDTFSKKSLFIEFFFFFNLISKFSDKSVSSLNFEELIVFPDNGQVKVNSEKKRIKFLFDAIRTDLDDKRIRKKNKCIEMNQIRKEVTRWSYKLRDELEKLDGKTEEKKYGIRSRKAKRVVIFTFTKNNLTKKNQSENKDTYKYTINSNNTDNTGELALIRYAQQPDFRRDIIKGSIRAQRRKTVTWKFFQKSLHSPLFLDKIEKSSFFSFFKKLETMRNFFFRFENSDYSFYREENKKETQGEGELTKKEKDEKRRIEVGEAWDSIIFAQVIRGYLLISQSILRKYILLPSFIITKNIVRMLLFQFPEWSQDFRDWQKEMYIKCTYNGVQLSETEFPKKWLLDGIQIKILFPFRLKPWHRSKRRSTEKYLIKKEEKKKRDFCFLTIMGTEVELPFSRYPRNRFYFFEPIFKKLENKMKKWKKNFFMVLKILNERTKLFFNFLKERAKSIIKNILFIIEKIIKEFTLFRLKISGLSVTQKDSTISNKNPMIYESTIRIQSINWKNCSLKYIYIKKLNAETKTILNKIKKMTKGKGDITSEINISSNKASYYPKRLGFKKNIFEILKKRNPILARKSKNSLFDRKSKDSSFESLMERVYLDIFLFIISIPRIDVQFFHESISIKRIEKKKIETNEERTDKKKKSLTHFISLIKKWNSIRNTNSPNSCDVSALSQAYVFFKLSETQVINISKLRSAFEYHGKYVFLKNEIKYFFFGIERILNCKLRKNKPINYVMNQWTNWLLKGHYQYDLSHRRWSRLLQKKWRNRIHERRVSQKKKLKKRDSYEKTRLILYKNKQLDSLKKKQQQYEYDLFSYKYINYAYKKHSYIYGSPFQAKKNEAIYKTRKQKIFDLTNDISIKNSIAEDSIIDMEKNMDRKYFDWVGMNEETFNPSIPDRKFLFFSKIGIFDNAYIGNPWIIPIQLLFLDYNRNRDVSENKNITGRKKIIDIFKSSKKKKKEFDLGTLNQAKAEAEYTGRVDLKSPLSTQEKDLEEDYAELDRKEDINKKQSESEIKKKLNLLLESFFVVHLHWQGSVNKQVRNNIKIYCLLMRLKNLKEIAVSSIQRGELNLDLMMIQNSKDFTLTDTELMEKNRFLKEGIVIIEPVRLYKENDEEYFMYKTIGLSLIHKRKRQINQRYLAKTHIDKKKFDKSIPRTSNEKRTENKEKNHYSLLVPEIFFSARRRREFRILMSFNSKNTNSVHRTTTFYKKNQVNNYCKVLLEKKDRDIEKNKLMNFYFFLWPICRLEDLACMNRYWFYTSNGSRFSMIRIHMYPPLRIRYYGFLSSI
uniref:Hypothetical chloroplast RF19 n=1 Tax=Smithia erubescens TaxID=2723576 RepID=A0A6H0EKX6_9FABA|nr:hypothetical chloroplast RF19 [Smithia erubescens]QIT02006.1 hypothetical chloroplast RF19 [Smithia erubescens]